MVQIIPFLQNRNCSSCTHAHRIINMSSDCQEKFHGAPDKKKQKEEVYLCYFFFVSYNQIVKIIASKLTLKTVVVFLHV